LQATGTSGRVNYETPKGISFVAPIQKAAHEMMVEVRNVEDKLTVSSSVERAWPVLLALAVWLYGLTREGSARRAAGAVGWSLMFWAALRWPNGISMFFMLVSLPAVTAPGVNVREAQIPMALTI